jgi:AcrR family transcriptional regulator
MRPAAVQPQGEPNVSTLEIANELGISPGNLYYHFHGKEPLVIGLFERFEEQLMRCSTRRWTCAWTPRTTGCSCT